MSILSCYLDNSDKEHLALLKTVFRYISETLDIKLIFINNTANNLIKYTNVNFVRVINSHKLTDNYIFIFTEEYILY